MRIGLGSRSTVDESVTEKDQVTAPDRINPFGSSVNSTGKRLQTGLRPPILRRWADNSEWCRAAINHRRVQVSQSSWSIQAIDPDEPFDEALAATIELLLMHPNPKQKTFRELIEPVVEDILVLDQGVIEKEITLGGLPTALYLSDGGDIRTRRDWNGSPTEPRYEWWPNNRFETTLLDSQIMLMMANPTSFRVEGFSPLEALKQAIDADLEARDYNKRLVQQVSPTGILNLGENVGTNLVDQFRVYWDMEVAGKKQMAIVGGVKNPEFLNTGQTARDMQFMQWQVYLLRKIAAVFGIAPQDLGITFDVNRANAQTQQELSEDRGLRPLLRLIEEQFNTKVIADFATKKAKQLYASGDIDNLTMRLAVGLAHINPRGHQAIFTKLHKANILNLMFRFRLKSAKATRDLAEFNKAALAGFPFRTINEQRADDGFDGVEGGDKIWVMTPVGAVSLDMIGGTELTQTPEQEKHIAGLFANPAVRVQSVPITGPEQDSEKEIIIQQGETVYVDEDGEEVDD